MVQEKSLGDLASLGYLNKPMTAKPSKYPQKYFKPKGCKWCGGLFDPAGPSHMYCGLGCRKLGRADGRFRKVYGITGEAAAVMYNKQGGLCKICRTEGFLMHENKTHGLSLDHCHKTGKVRGWLCDNCNRGLGLLQDNPKLLESAIEYLNSE